MQEELLDTIETSTLKIVGIVDYVSSKHITIYDMSNNDDPELSMAAIIYKLYFSDMRFSVYKSLYFNHHQIPPPIMINKSAIKRSSKKLITQKPKKQTFKFTNKT